MGSDNLAALSVLFFIGSRERCLDTLNHALTLNTPLLFEMINNRIDNF